MINSNNIALVITIYKDEECKIAKKFFIEHKNQYKVYLADCRTSNKGYAHNINTGIRKAINDKFQIILISNLDIETKNIRKKYVLDGLKHFDILGFAMKQDGQMLYGGKIDARRMSGGMITQKPTKQYTPVDFVSGSFMVITKKVIDKIGYLNENYFMYYEDVEYCYLAKKHGLKVGIDSKHYYTHFETSKNNPDKERYLFRNRFIFFMKYSNLKQKLRELLRLPKTVIEHLPLLVSALKQSPFLNNFFSHNISSILSKIAHFVIFVVLVRTLSPNQYGIYTVVWAFVNMFTPFLDFGTTTFGLVHGQKGKTDIKKIFSLRFYLSLIVYLTVAISSILIFRDNLLRIFALLTATSVFSSSLSGSYLIWNSLREKVYVSSWLNLAFNVGFAICVVAALLLHKGITYLFLSYALCYSLYALLNMLLIKEQLSLKIDLKNWFRILKQSLIFVVIGFLANFYFKADIFFLKFFQGAKAVGIYSAGVKFLDTLLILPASYNIVVIPIMRRIAHHHSALRVKAVKDSLFLLGFGLLITLSFYFLSPFILPILLKRSFANSLAIARISAFAIVPIMLVSVCYNSLYALRKDKYVLFILTIQTIISLITFGVLVPKLSLYGIVYLKVILEIFDVTVSFIVLKFAFKHASIKNLA